MDLLFLEFSGASEDLNTFTYLTNKQLRSHADALLVYLSLTEIPRSIRRSVAFLETILVTTLPIRIAGSLSLDKLLDTCLRRAFKLSLMYSLAPLLLICFAYRSRKGHVFYFIADPFNSFDRVFRVIIFNLAQLQNISSLFTEHQYVG